MSIIFAGTVTADGKVSPDDPQTLQKRLERWDGKRVTVTVEKAEGKTQSQLGYFFVTVVPEWAKHLGYDEVEMYEALWLSCMPYRSAVNRLTGEEVRYQPRLSDASKEEASEFLDACIREAAKQGWPVSPPRYRS